MTTNTHRLGRTLGAGLAGLAMLVGAAGCNNAGEGATSGAALGALGGLAIGSLSGDAGKGAIIGTVAGALGGAILGDQNERNSRSSPAVYSSTPPSRSSSDDCGRCDDDHYTYNPKMSRTPDAVYEHHHYHHD